MTFPERPLPTVYRPRAIADIDEIGEFLAERSSDAATSFPVRVEETARALAAMPLLGTLVVTRSRRARGTRMCLVRKFASYLLFYRVDRGTLVVLRVRHGATNWRGPGR